MKTNKEYWKNKENRVEIAVSHTKEMSKYGTQENIIYSKEVYAPTIITNIPCKSELWEENTVDAFLKAYKEIGKNEKYCLLNFASYKNPGGGFLQTTHDRRPRCFSIVE